MYSQCPPQTGCGGKSQPRSRMRVFLRFLVEHYWRGNKHPISDRRRTAPPRFRLSVPPANSQRNSIYCDLGVFVDRSM